MTKNNDALPENFPAAGLKERVVAWVWLLDREEVGDFYQREVWKTLDVGPFGPSSEEYLWPDKAAPITEREAENFLKQTGNNFEMALYAKFGIKDLDSRIGLPKGPYYDAVDLDMLRQRLEKALKEPNRGSENATDAADFLSGKVNEALCFIKESIAERVQHEFGSDPHILYKLSPSDFTRLVAEIMRDMGADVHAVQEDARGGADILAYMTLPTSQKILTIVECKHTNSDREIRPSTIKQFLFTAREQIHATNAMYVTTAHFSKKAKYLEEQFKYILTLQDYGALSEWLSQYGKWNRSSKGGIWIPHNYSEQGKQSADIVLPKGKPGQAVNISADTGPLRILFLASNPKNTERLRIDEEFRAIDQALRLSKFRDRFEIKQQWAVRVEDLQEYLLRYKPNIVHFSGHGSNSSEIILEDNQGDSFPVPPQALTDLFTLFKDQLYCVILNACYSERQAQAIAKNIPYVIGMSRSIGDQSAIYFSTAFYRALGYGESIEKACQFGRLQMHLNNTGEHEIPKLIKN